MVGSPSRKGPTGIWHPVGWTGLDRVRHVLDFSTGSLLTLEKEMAAHSSILAWEMPWTEEPGRLVCGVTKNYTGLSD